MAIAVSFSQEAGGPASGSRELVAALKFEVSPLHSYLDSKQYPRFYLEPCLLTKGRVISSFPSTFASFSTPRRMIRGSKAVKPKSSPGRTFAMAYLDKGGTSSPF